MPRTVVTEVMRSNEGKESEEILDACLALLSTGAPEMQNRFERNTPPYRFRFRIPVPADLLTGTRIPQNAYLKLVISGIFHGINQISGHSQFELTEVEKLYFPLARTFTRFHRPLHADYVVLDASIVAFEKYKRSGATRLMFEFALLDPNYSFDPSRPLFDVSDAAYVSGFLVVAVRNLHGVHPVSKEIINPGPPYALPESRESVFFRSAEKNSPYIARERFPLEYLRPRDNFDGYVGQFANTTRRLFETKMEDMNLKVIENSQIVRVNFNDLDAYGELSASNYLSLFLTAFRNQRSEHGFNDSLMLRRNYAFHVDTSSISHQIPIQGDVASVELRWKIVSANQNLSQLNLEFQIAKTPGFSSKSHNLKTSDPPIRPYAKGYLTLSLRNRILAQDIERIALRLPPELGHAVALPQDFYPLFFKNIPKK